jgi:NADPH:quinone reductase-like Zn-dependent oxidoreductase
MLTMKAIKLKKPAGLDQFEVEDVTLPQVTRGDIRVRLHASSLNVHDYFVVKGVLPTEEGRIPLSDGAGEVVETAGDVTEFSPGDRVISTFFPNWLAGKPTAERVGSISGDTVDGYARDEVVAPATAFTRAPRGYSDVEAATLPCAGLTAWRALFVEASVQPGETVLIQGTGGVSSFAFQFAKAAGARIIAMSSTDAKLERLRSMGAHELINYKRNPEWGRVARELTGGRGVDHVVEVGGPGNLAQSLEACTFGGNIALIGVITGFAGELPIGPMLTKNLRLTGMAVGSRENQVAMVRAIEANDIKPVVDKTFPRDELAEALRYHETGTHVGKICLKW